MEKVLSQILFHEQDKSKQCTRVHRFPKTAEGYERAGGGGEGGNCVKNNYNHNKH